MSDFSETDLLQEQLKRFYEQKKKDAEDYLWMSNAYKEDLGAIGKILGIKGTFGVNYGTNKLIEVLQNILEETND